MGEITTLGYILIFVFGIIVKLIWGMLGIVFLAWMHFIYTLVNEIFEPIWESSSNEKYGFMIKFFLLLLLGFATMIFFRAYFEILENVDLENYFFRLFPLYDALTN